MEGLIELGIPFSGGVPHTKDHSTLEPRLGDETPAFCQQDAWEDLSAELLNLRGPQHCNCQSAVQSGQIGSTRSTTKAPYIKPFHEPCVLLCNND